MKRAWIAFLALAIIACAITRLTADEKQPGDTGINKKIEELTAQVKALESKVKTLEQKTARLEHPPMTPPSQVLPSLPNVGSLGSNQTPKIWGQGQCNGWSYYIVPLKADSAAISLVK
jgi:outer membrane murein-binding lipoprotein Lpp